MTAIIKLLFDLCFYYTLSGFFIYLAAEAYPGVWGIPLIIAANTVYLVLKKCRPDAEEHSERTQIRPLAIVCCALPAIALLLHPTLWQILQYLPAWAYLCFVIWSGRSSVTYMEFEDHFAFTGKLYLLMFFGLLMLNRIPGALAGAVPYFALYILSGVYLMRILREEGRLSAGRSAAALLGLLFGAVAITVFRAPQLLLTIVGFLYRNVIVWVLTGLGVIIAAVGYVFYLLIAGIISLFGRTPVQPDFNLAMLAQDILGEEPVSAESASLLWLKAVLLALLAIIIILAVFLIFRRLLGSKSSAGKESAYKIEQERLDKRAHKTGAGFRPKDHRLAVRWYYRKYLKEGISRGAQLGPSDTSKSVQLKYASFFTGNASDRIRDLYIKTRYALWYPVQSCDVSEMQELWKNLKR